MNPCRKTAVVDPHIARAPRSLVGLGDLSPLLRWRLAASRRGVCQVAFQVAGAASLEALLAGDHLWDTGKVEGEAIPQWRYAGPRLMSRQRCVWRVRAWTNVDGQPTDWSAPAHFEMGLLHPTDWEAHWIAPDQQLTFVERYTPERDELRGKLPKTLIDTALLRPAQFLRTVFTLDAVPVKARLYVTAHGAYRAYLNGSRANEHELTPDWTTYASLLTVQASDVTPHLKKGRNALGFILSDGWWAGRIGMHGSSANYGDRLSLLAQLEVDFPDGRRQIIGTDTSFRSATAEITYADFLMGEKHDLRHRQERWSFDNFDDSDWTPTRLTSEGFDTLKPQIGEPVAIAASIPCKRIFKTPNGQTVLDFGQNLTGRFRAVLQGSRGTEVIFDYAQSLDEDGNLFDNVLAMNQQNRDVVILSGGKNDCFEAMFSLHGFRYVGVTGYGGDLREADCTAIALSSLSTRIGSFSCSNEKLNRLQSNIEWTIRSTMLSVPMDNPDRERVGWAGDMALIAPTAAAQFDMEGFLARWLANLREEQGVDGSVPMVIPMFDGYRSWFESRFKTCATSGWGDASVLVPWAAYQAYGDVRFLEENYDAMVRWMRYVMRQAQNSLSAADREDPALSHLWRATGFHFGDWLAPGIRTLTANGMYDGRVMSTETKELIPTLWYAHSTAILSKVAAILGRSDDAHHFAQLCERVKRSFCAAFVQGDRLTSDLQGNYVLALAFDMAPAKRKAFADRLVELIRDNGNRLNTGFVSTPHLLHVLADSGNLDIAYELLLSNANPSWLYQVDRGATTIWEMWDSVLSDGTVTRTSQIQPALGTVGQWLTQRVAGLRPASPGCMKVQIEPLVGHGLDAARAEYMAPAGKIAVEWRLADSELHVHVSLPPCTSATVRLPNVQPEAVREGGTALVLRTELSYQVQGEDTLIFAASGDYEFRAPCQ